MATIISYKRLFEVRLLHEYYLLSSDESSFFDMPLNDRNNLLKKRILKGQYRLNRDIEVVLDAGTEVLFKALNWHFVPTATGFAIAVRTKIKTVNGADVEVPYTPFPLPAPPLYFHIQTRNVVFKNYTFNYLAKGPLPLIYYFSNRPESVHDTDFAALSLPVLPFVAGKNYEMGDIAQIGPDILEAPVNTDSNLNWLAVQGKGWVNENDRICLSKTFRYRFASSNTANEAVFKLKSADGSIELKTINSKSTAPLNVVSLDFSSRKNVQNIDVEVPDGLYQLDIEVGSTTQTQPLYLSNAYRSQAYGLIHINVDQPDTLYSVLNTDGSIRNLNPDPLGERMHPVFEVRLRSRKTYWRYVPIFRDDTFQPHSSLANYLEQEGDSLITRRPQIFTYLPFGVLSTNDLDPPEVKLPAPRSPAFKSRGPDKLVTEISTLPIDGKIV